MFTGSVAPWKLDDFCGFEAPVYVLDKRLKEGLVWQNERLKVGDECMLVTL
jgi:hypothetical protein